MKRFARFLAVAGLLAVNALLAQRLVAATRVVDDKGHCDWGAGTCVTPCDHTNHFCICTGNADCRLNEE